MSILSFLKKKPKANETFDYLLDDDEDDDGDYYIDDEPPEGYFDDKDDPYDYDDSDQIPFVCRSCGGPYPNCVDSCKLFEDS